MASNNNLASVRSGMDVPSIITINRHERNLIWVALEMRAAEIMKENADWRTTTERAKEVRGAAAELRELAMREFGA